MATGLLKFANQRDGGARGQFHWGRADVDGLPFRGKNVPNYTEAEFEERLVRVADAHNGTFRTWIAAENKAYLEVLDEIMNGWSIGHFIEHWREEIEIDGRKQQGHVVYLEWAKCCYEDGSQAPRAMGGKR